jgi:inorganic pyrophosphatase
MKLTQRRNRLLLPIGVNAPLEVNVVVEIQSGSRNKIVYDRALDIFRLDRTLHSPIFYPGDYGFVPQTLAHDGEPLDVLVLVSNPSFSGCLLAVRPIGVLKMIDEGKRDEKIIAVPVGEPEYADTFELDGISGHELRRIEHFFATYKLLEGLKTHSEGWGPAAVARELITESNVDFSDDSNAKRT